MARFIPLLLLVLWLFAPRAAAQDPLTQKALERIEKVEGLEKDLKAGDKQQAAYCLNQLAWAGKRLNVVSDKTEAHWKDAKKRYDALWKKIEDKSNAGGPKPTPKAYDHAKLVQLNKEIGNAYENLKLLSVKHLADEYRVSSIKKELRDFGKRLEAFPKDDDNVKLVTANLADFQKLFDAGMSQLEEGQAAKGGVLKRIEELRAKYDSDNVPGNLDHPFSEPQLRAWAAEMRRFREKELPADVAWLREASGNAAVDQQKVNSMFHWLTGTWARRLDEVEKLVRERVASDVWTGQESAKFILETDASDPNHVLNRVLGKGRFDEQMTWLRNGQHAVAMARVYDDAMGSPAVLGPTITDPKAPRPEQPDRDAQQATVEEAIAYLKRLAKSTLEAVRMPEPASTDADLLRIAAETLVRPEYEVGEWKQLVINADKSHKVRREAWIEPGSTYLTLSYYVYEWDQFQVTTAEKVGDEWWLYSNLLKHYTSGDPTTPVDRWILSRRFELTPILAEHLGE